MKYHTIESYYDLVHYSGIDILGKNRLEKASDRLDLIFLSKQYTGFI